MDRQEPTERIHQNTLAFLQAKIDFLRFRSKYVHRVTFGVEFRNKIKNCKKNPILGRKRQFFKNALF